ncbi:MAG TPA: hypothetical protein VHW64_15080 [Nocardioides sp.]|jgi:YVTN family beta-propeller protein|uniref:hypothetical protein n=1 Tax=Nocardioides sp. TaxID=35761 RepID=UPI002E370884|nr:hypothetical protein [Nocardioides sp.]HEX3932025.1 hypothetical protein [Nocardioides sp.]
MNRPEDARARRRTRSAVLGIPALLGVALGALALPSPANAVGAGTYAYATSASGVSVVDTATGTVAASITTANAAQTVVSPNGLRAYSIDYSAGTVAVIDTAQEAVVDTVALPDGSAPDAEALSPDGSKLYVADYYDSRVFVLDTATGSVSATIATGQYPDAIAATATHLYVADFGTDGSTDNISVVDVATNAVTSTIATPDAVATFAVVPGTNLMYAAGYDDSNLMVLDLSTNTMLRTQTDISGITALAVSPDGSRTYVATLHNGIYALDSVSGTLILSADAGQVGAGAGGVVDMSVASTGAIELGVNISGGSLVVGVAPTTLTASTTSTTLASMVDLSTGTIAPAPAGKADVQTKITGPTSGSTGKAYTYTETVKNAGPGVASKVGATFLVPPGASLVSASGSYTKIDTPIGRLVVWRTVPSMAASASSTYTVTLKFTGKGTKVLTGVAGSLSTPDPKLVNNLALATTKVK